VRAAIEAIELDAGVSSFAIGKIRRVKHSRISGTVELKFIFGRVRATRGLKARRLGQMLGLLG
jgi:hypothetical protein